MTPPVQPDEASSARDPSNGALYALGFATALVAVDAINRRKSKTEFIENAAIATIVGVTVEYLRGRR